MLNNHRKRLMFINGGDKWTVSTHFLYKASVRLYSILLLTIKNRPGVAGAVLQTHSSLRRSSFSSKSSEHLHSQTVRAREIQFWEKDHLPPPPVTCHVSHVGCHVSHAAPCEVTYQTRKTKYFLLIESELYFLWDGQYSEVRHGQKANLTQLTKKL